MLLLLENRSNSTSPAVYVPPTIGKSSQVEILAFEALREPVTKDQPSSSKSMALLQLKNIVLRAMKHNLLKLSDV